MCFGDFFNMNEAIAVPTDKKRLNKIFIIMDRNKAGYLRLEDIKNFVQFKFSLDDEDKDKEQGDDWNIKEEDLKGNELMVRQ